MTRVEIHLLGTIGSSGLCKTEPNSPIDTPVGAPFHKSRLL